jgi:multidrug efflux pump
MKLSHFCIDRPIFASVISIVIALGGLLAMFALPVAQYPDITPPQITITASYPGASADVVANNVAAPIEQQVNGADNMIYMTSSSSSTGSLTINAFFRNGTNPDLAQVDVQNRINLALPQLPQSVQSQGVQVQKKSSAFMMVIAVYSPDHRFDSTYVANYANVYVLDALKRIPGANQASIFGTPDYAMRIWLRPDRMAQLGITATDVQNAVANQNQQFAVGRLGQAPTGLPVEQSFAVTTSGRLANPAEFDNIIIRASSNGAAIVRLKDVGRAELGQKDYSIRSRFQGEPATVIAIYQQPGANALDVSKQVRATLAEMKRSFPEGIDYNIAMDTTDFTRASIADVVKTFFEAVVLVVIVVFVFLQSFRATLIPVLAVPVSILGTFMGMAALGFSINMLTMFGMVLAIGIVVDDAIVVIENVERNMREFGLSPNAAAKRAMDEVSGPVVTIVLVMCAVFVPVAFLGGITGQMYKQFAITIAISVVLSGVVALTLSPALAAVLLKPQAHAKHRFFRWFDNAFAQVTAGYGRAVSLTIRRFGVALLLFAGMLLLAVTMMRSIPHAFLPPEDQGYLLGAVIMPDSASLDRTGRVSSRVTDYFAKQPGVGSVTVVDGYSLLDNQTMNNASTFFVGLKDFDERYAWANIHAECACVAARRLPGAVAHQGRYRRAGQPAVDSRARHDGRHRNVDSEQRRRDYGATRAGRAGFCREGEGASRTGGRHVDLQRLIAAVACRCGSRQGGHTRRADRRGVQHDADPVRLAVRFAVQSVEPSVAGHSPGGALIPVEARGSRAGIRAQHHGHDGPAQIGRDVSVRDRTVPDDALQRFPRRADHRQCSTGPQLRRGDRRAGGACANHARGIWRGMERRSL